MYSEGTYYYILVSLATLIYLEHQCVAIVLLKLCCHDHTCPPKYIIGRFSWPDTCMAFQQPPQVGAMHITVVIAR